MAKYADSVMKEKKGVFGGGDELDMWEFFPEFVDEELRLKGGEYGAEIGYIPVDEFADFEAFDYGPSMIYEELIVKMPVALAVDLKKAAEIARQGIMPVLYMGERGAAVCDPLNLLWQ